VCCFSAVSSLTVIFSGFSSTVIFDSFRSTALFASSGLVYLDCSVCFSAWDSVCVFTSSTISWLCSFCWFSSSVCF